MSTRFDERVAELRGFTSEVVRYKRLAVSLWTSALVLAPLSCLLVVFLWSKWNTKQPQPPQPAPPPAAQRVINPFEEEIRKTSVQEWFGRLGRDEQLGYKPFTVMNALVTKAKQGEKARDQVILQAGETIDDLRQNLFKRWQCCYVLSGIGDARGIPAITRALRDQSPIVRGVAACALGVFDHPDARSALETALKRERDLKVRQELQKALQGGYLKQSPR